ncbi:aldo/keto reductase [Candidatus Peregrinibacteria bacterium]|nr:aldo/keto reductase [Candidatus Peregrinibacteria bacterium]
MNYGINNSTGKPSFAAIKKIVQTALASGITCFDTAPEYGDTEKMLGQCLTNIDKQGLFFISKLPPMDWSLSQEEIIDRVSTSIRRTCTDLAIPCIPIYLFHRFQDLQKENGLLLHELKQMKTRGVINHIGVSIYTQQEAEIAISIPELEVIQFPFNLVDKRLLFNGMLTRATKKKKMLLARSVFLQGLFFKEDLPSHLLPFKPYQQLLRNIAEETHLSLEELALRYVLGIEEIHRILVGVETVKQLQEDVEIFKKGKLPQQVIDRINTLASPPENIINPSLWGKS